MFGVDPSTEPRFAANTAAIAGGGVSPFFIHMIWKRGLFRVVCAMLVAVDRSTELKAPIACSSRPSLGAALASIWTSHLPTFVLSRWAKPTRSEALGNSTASRVVMFSVPAPPVNLTPPFVTDAPPARVDVAPAGSSPVSWTRIQSLPRTPDEITVSVTTPSRDVAETPSSGCRLM